ncbi:MAG: transposase, partial [Succinivibrio sp.]
INAFARAYLSSVAKQIKKDILHNCPVIIMDESTLRVNETAKVKQAEGKGFKSQIWTLNSSWTSKIQASYYSVSPSRSADELISILKNDLKDESGNVATRYLLSDGYSGYDAGIKELNQIDGVFLKSCRCMTHGRRGLWKYLKSNGLLDVYGKLLQEGSSFFDFKDNLTEYLKTKKGRKLNSNDVALLTIFYLINALFVIESSVVRKHGYICTTEEFKQDLKAARTRYSQPIADTLFDNIRLYIANNPHLIIPRVSNDGSIRFSQNRRYPESAALIYLLNFETELKRFTESADIELSTSKAERSLKLGICARKSFMFLASEDGGHAFADYQTIVNTCNLNRVPPLSYMIWLVANIKYRMHLLENEGHGGAMGLAMPKKERIIVQKADGSKTKELIAMYDKRNITDFDKIDVTGLTPYDYKRYLDEHTPRQ